MDFDKKSHEIFRNWYVDGRLYYLKVIDFKKPEDGIQDLRQIDPLKIKHIRQEKKLAGNKSLINLRDQESDNIGTTEIEEYFLYSPGGTNKNTKAFTA